jgi:hypothetical protein
MSDKETELTPTKSSNTKSEGRESSEKGHSGSIEPELLKDLLKTPEKQGSSH